MILIITIIFFQLQNLLKDPNSQESLCYFFDNFRNTIKNPLSETHFDVLCKILLKIINPVYFFKP